jgi:hypothetical protein
MQSVLLILLIAACVWLAFAESIVSALVFFVFGLVVIGGLSFMLELGGAVGGFVDHFIRRFGRRR